MAAEITGDARSVRDATRIIFPGVGAAGSAMRSLRKGGLDQALVDAFAAGVPMLGICLGLQVSLSYSEENETPMLDLIDGRVTRFQMRDPALKVPHMGWNEVQVVKSHPLLRDVVAGDEFYFVHAYYPAPRDAGLVHAVSDYESSFCCALGTGSYFGTQFHPEKSGRVGLRLLERFAAWDGRAE